MLPLCRAEGIGVIPWSPLARGRLTRGWDERAPSASETDEFGKTLYAQPQEADRTVVERVARGGGRARRAAGAGGARLAARQAGRSRRRSSARRSRSTSRTRVAARRVQAHRRGDRARSRSPTCRTPVVGVLLRGEDKIGRTECHLISTTTQEISSDRPSN